MSLTSKFALVPKSASTLEKVRPGAARILSRMIADTLVLTKVKPAVSRPKQIVLVNDEWSVLESFRIVLKTWFKDATIVTFENGEDALKELLTMEPDFLITDDVMPLMPGSKLCERLLEQNVRYPIIVNSPWEPTRDWVRRFAQRGLNIWLLPLPASADSIRGVLEATGLRLHSQTDETLIKIKGNQLTSPRIVLVNDNPPVLQAVEEMIKLWSKEEATLVMVQSAADVCHALSEQNPDVLLWIVSAPLLRGKDTIESLVKKKVEYPIIVASTFEPDKLWVQEFAGRGLEISFLPMPFDFDTLRRLLDGGFDSGD